MKVMLVERVRATPSLALFAVLMLVAFGLVLTLNGLTIGEANAKLREVFGQIYAGVSGDSPASEVRVTLGRFTTQDDLQRFVQALTDIVQALRNKESKQGKETY